ALHDAGPEPLDQRIGGAREATRERHPLRLLEVHGDGRPPAAVGTGVARDGAAGTRALEADDVGAHVGQEHRRERTGSDRAELQDLDPVERAHATDCQRSARYPSAYSATIARCSWFWPSTTWKIFASRK